MILAPMQGLTEVLFRRVYEECFPGAIRLSVSPFISLTHNLQHSKGKAKESLLADVLPENNIGSIPVVPQILGKESGEFVEMSNILYDLGYREMNWNIGCPMRNITGKHRGSGILPYPDEVREILDNTVPRMKLQLSIKMRIGLRSKDEIFALIPILNDYPLASVTIHPRTGRQQYTGVPDLDTFGEALHLIKHPVIYNGDIRTPDDARRIKARFPEVSDIMVGRGVLYRPTLPLELNGQHPDSTTKLASRFINRLMEEIKVTLPTEQSILRKTKEYWSLLWKSLPISEMQAREVLRAQQFTVVDNLICQLTQ
jgi:tRNA-dihydrouridine synthase